jgi:RNA polymerase sigma-70 factor (ECF subfamily)
MRTWLYRIATNACLNVLERSGRKRVLPAGLGPASTDGPGVLADHAPEIAWLQPLPDAAVADPATDDPATIADRRETTRLAFVAALQHLPARQRAALLLRDVLDLSAAETAEVLELSVASVNSALQRARAQLAARRARDERAEEEDTMPPSPIDERVVAQYVAAFEASDVGLLAGLLRRDVCLEMPPIPTWFSGYDEVLRFFAERVIGSGAVRRLLPICANGGLGVAAYVRQADGTMQAHSIQVLEIEDGGISRIYAFLDRSLFAAFGLPETIDA